MGDEGIEPPASQTLGGDHRGQLSALFTELIPQSAGLGAPCVVAPLCSLHLSVTAGHDDPVLIATRLPKYSTSNFYLSTLHGSH